MEKIYSKINKEEILHIVYKKSEIINRREEFASDKEFLQVAAIMLKKDEEVSAHKHLPNQRAINLTQEFVVVVEGKIEVGFYDVDNSLIKIAALWAGDCYASFAGGHSVKAVEENTKLYEIKNGPYIGREKDKVNI